MPVSTTKSIKIFPLILGPCFFIFMDSMTPIEPFSETAWHVMSVAGWMIIWWVTEAIPIFVTAILPMVMFPLLNVFTIKEATSHYAHPIIFLFLGGFLIALGIEHRNLHRRIALNLVRLTGTHPNGIILGFMLATAFISMWISNTATTVMMLPIALSVVNLLAKEKKELVEKSFNRFALGLMLGIAYAANIGGAITIIGTPPNVVSIGFIHDLLNREISFSEWLVVGLPVGAVLIALTYLLITKVIYPSRIKSFAASEKLFDDNIEALGKFSKPEILVSIVFVTTAILWILRQPLNNLIGTNSLNDTIIAMAGGMLMFIIPVNIKKGEFLVPWEETKQLPWGILILFGGGMCLAKGMETAGLVQLIGESIAAQGTINLWLLALILTSIMLFMTELMSNIALATIFIPVVIGIAQGFNYDPLVLVIPATMSASYAFMMPISTPPNAIVFSSGHIRIKEMMRIGIFLNLLSIAVLMLAAYFIVQHYF